MKKVSIIAVLVLLLPLGVDAQWRVGVGMGASYNTYSMDLQYMTDCALGGKAGIHGAVMGQYCFNDWFALRADLDFTQRNWHYFRKLYEIFDHVYFNEYLLLPVMASLSCGGSRLRGFLNLGMYGGYWLSAERSGKDYDSASDRPYNFGEHLEFNYKKDQRWDYGAVAGLGMEYRFARHWAVQLEARYWYSMESQVKQYMKVKDYRYNNTSTFQVGMFYCF